ncbi:UNVERIFIED_CONTAM: hypothetical protein FKN15_048219 [Acipenser sinensis]
MQPFCGSIGRQWLSHASPCSGRRLRLPALPAFPDFMEEVCSSGLSTECTEASGTACFLGMHGKAGPGGFSPSRFNYCGLGQGSVGGGITQGPCVPEPAVQGHGDAPKRAYAAEAQVTSLANTAGILTAYMDGILREAGAFRITPSFMYVAPALRPSRASPMREPGKPGGGSQTAMAVTGKGPRCR